MEEPGDKAHSAFIGLGSNLGDREAYLYKATELLGGHPSVSVKQYSGIYETAPVGYVDQPAFLNMVVALETGLWAEPLFRFMMEVEQRLGRARDIRWGPRTIDLDLLLYDHIELRTPELTIPHPRMLERAFVLIPFSDLIDRKQVSHVESIANALEKLGGRDEVKLWKQVSWHSELGLSAN